ncbi:MAG: YetF domain-containing protein [Candidatus Dependentiae bacterium]
MLNGIDFSMVSLASIFFMMVRATIIYFLGIIFARFNKKLVGVRNPFNFVIFVMLGSMLAQAIVFPEFFIPILCSLFFLIVLNICITMLVFHVPFLELLIKGKPVKLVVNGKIQSRAMEKNSITKDELLNELQTQLQTRDLKRVESAVLASDGTIKFTVKED